MFLDAAYEPLPSSSTSPAGSAGQILGVGWPLFIGIAVAVAAIAVLAVILIARTVAVRKNRSGGNRPAGKD